eukprot:m.44097 g.44097  ORF g.44097 m.44097 type:complete len:241 (-) comp14897_c0_seq4:127-849(-)
MIEVSPPLTRKPKARTRRARRAAEKVGGGSARAHTVTDKESALFSDDDAPQKEDQRAGAAPKSEGDDDAKFIGSAIALAVITFQIMSNWWDSILFFTAMMACIACGIAMFFTGLQRVVATSTISIRTVDEVVKLEPGPPPGEFAKIFARFVPPADRAAVRGGSSSETVTHDVTHVHYSVGLARIGALFAGYNTLLTAFRLIAVTGWMTGGLFFAGVGGAVVMICFNKSGWRYLESAQYVL